MSVLFDLAQGKRQVQSPEFLLQCRHDKTIDHTPVWIHVAGCACVGAKWRIAGANQ